MSFFHFRCYLFDNKILSFCQNNNNNNKSLSTHILPFFWAKFDFPVFSTNFHTCLFSFFFFAMIWHKWSEPLIFSKYIFKDPHKKSARLDIGVGEFKHYYGFCVQQLPLLLLSNGVLSKMLLYIARKYTSIFANIERKLSLWVWLTPILLSQFLCHFLGNGKRSCHHTRAVWMLLSVS